MSARIVVRRCRKDHDCRFPWAATFPCCEFMNSLSGHGWPTWRGAFDHAVRHLRQRHGIEVAS